MGHLYEPDESGPPPVPAFELDRIVLIRQAIRADLEQCVGGRFAGEDFERLVRRVAGHLPAAVPRTAVRASLAPLLGAELTERLALDLAWRLAGNLPRLRAGEVVPPWSPAAVVLEWVPLQVTRLQWRLRPGRAGRGEQSGHLIEALCLAGLPAGRVARFFWSAGLERYASREFGFSRASGKYPRSAAAEFVQLRSAVLFEPHWRLESLELPPKARFRVTPSMRAYNRLLMAKRARRGFACPRDYTHPCHLCPVGYDECPVATHPRHHRLTERCPGCGRRAWVDASLPDNTLCLDCRPLTDSGRPPKRTLTQETTP